MSSSKKKKKEKKSKTGVANTKANKGKQKQIVHATIAPVDTEPQHKMTKAERKAARRAEKKLEQIATNSPLDFAPVCLSYN